MIKLSRFDIRLIKTVFRIFFVRMFFGFLLIMILVGCINIECMGLKYKKRRLRRMSGWCPRQGLNLHDIAITST